MPPRDGLYVHRAGALAADDCARFVRGVYAARADWTPCFGGVQFTLGRAYYTHLEEDREGEYFDDAERSDALVERALPGMQERVLALVSEIVGAPVERRSGWCGPGVHIFPAGDHLARHGGDVHFDTEGLRAGERATRAPAWSVIVMLQPPRRGGGLRVWDATWTGDDEAPATIALGEDGLRPSEPVAGGFGNPPRVPETTIACATAEYAVGDLVAIDSYRLHQIQPFEGARDRVSVTAHAVRSDGRWQCWF